MCCPLGFFAGSSSCSPCPAGRFADEAFLPPNLARVTSASTCALCAAGRWGSALAAASAASCTACPAGKFNPFSGNTTAAACQICPNGTAAPAGSSACAPCPADSFAFSGAAACTPCPANTFSLGGGALCCPYGSFNRDGNATNCTLCPADTFSTEKYAVSPSVCKRCASGYAAAGSGACCAAGAYLPPGSLFCTNCPSGKFSQAFRLTSANQCANCSAGTFNTGGSSPCTACLAGYFCPEGKEFTQCPANTYNPVPSRASLDDCKPCGAGQSSEPGMPFCSATSLGCPAGKFTNGSLPGCGPATPGCCTPCAPGTFSANNNQSACLNCAPGFFSGFGDAQCLQCRKFGAPPPQTNPARPLNEPTSTHPNSQPFTPHKP